MRRTHMFAALAIAAALACSPERPAFTPGPAGPEALRSAAASLGYQVVSLETDIPAAVRPLYPFHCFGYNDSLLAEIRRRYELEKVVAPGRDEWEKQCLLKHWVHTHITNGTPTLPAENAIEVLDNSAKGALYWCSYYALTYMQCAQALGWTSRKLGLDRWHEATQEPGSRHHGVDEVWSNQFRKWVVIDCQSDLHYEKDGLPLSGWEIRAEWLKNQGADVARVVGAPERRELKNPAIVWWDIPGQDETALYFWIYYADNALGWQEEPPTRWILPQDSANAGKMWYQGGPKTAHPHTGYEKKMFLPSDDPAAFEWTVGVVEAQFSAAGPEGVSLSLDSYCPNPAGYEINVDGTGWIPVEGATAVWQPHEGANFIGLRTLNVAGVTGPELALRMELKK